MVKTLIFLPPTNHTNTQNSIDALRLHLRLLDPHIAALSPRSTAAVAALCEGEGAWPLLPGAAFEVRRSCVLSYQAQHKSMCLHTYSNTIIRSGGLPSLHQRERRPTSGLGHRLPAARCAVGWGRGAGQGGGGAVGAVAAGGGGVCGCVCVWHDDRGLCLGGQG